MGTLYIVSTPIGNLEDITMRAIKTLLSVPIIACEDTRRTGLLLSELYKRHQDHPHSKQVLVSFYDQIEAQKTPELIQLLESGKDVALVSDAGTPLVSDPGYLLVSNARRREIPVVSVPGPSAIITALTISGLPVNNFTFLGYPPEKSAHQIKLFNNILQMNRFICSTCVFYCAPHKLELTLSNLQQVLGDIEITIARELTKIHEQVWQGKISEAVGSLTNFKGELVLLFNIPPV